ncbi:MAG: long-chain-acyl-CoA synthetase [Sandaracinaceae bacterium]|nr:long-chain-acyl-CoA synthetase [Sandaracinaceae bacterium]
MARIDTELLRSNARMAQTIGYGIWLAAYKLRDNQNLCPALLLERHAARQPNHPALLFEDRTLSYQELNARANQYAHALERLGAKKGQVVAVLMDNRVEYLVACMGANKIGVVSALINTHVAGIQLSHALRICEPSFILLGSEHIDNVRGLGDEVPVAANRVLMMRDGDNRAQLPGAVDFDAVIDAAPAHNPEQTKQQSIHDPFVYIYTSGTTGLPKAAMMKNQRVMKAMHVFAGPVAHITPSDVVYTSGLPFYHSSGFILGYGMALVGGATCALRRKFSSSQHFEDCERTGATVFAYIGELCRYLLASEVKPAEKRHKLRMVVGAGLRPDIWEAFVKRFNIPEVREFYGATEGNVGIVNFDGKPGMLGRLMPGQVVARAEEGTADVWRNAHTGLCEKAHPGQDGILLGQINKVNSFDGYVDKGKNAGKILENPFGDGKNYFNTGDLVRMHPHKYVSFQDRLGDTYRWKGENVATSEVALVLTHAPSIGEANVYGVEVPGCDGRAGMAAVVLDGELDLPGLSAHVEKNLPGYARPLFIRVQREMQLTASFKYVKTDLKEQGFDPANVKGDPLFFWNGRAYEPLTTVLHEQLVSGAIRL